MHGDDVQNITDMISKIIKSRQKSAESDVDNSSDKDSLPLGIDTLPSQMIRNYASFLELVDYNYGFCKHEQTDLLRFKFALFID